MDSSEEQDAAVADALSSSLSSSSSSSSGPILVAVAIVVVTSLVLFLLKKRSRTPTVMQLNIYPIKSCGEQTVREAVATPTGFEHDRMTQIVTSEGLFCTPRESAYAKLFHVRPRVVVTAPASSTGRDNTKKNRVLFLEAPNVDAPFSIDLDGEGTTRTPILATAMETLGKVTLNDYGDHVAEWLSKATGITGCRLAGIGTDYQRHCKVNPDQGDPLPEANGATKKKHDVSLADEAPYLLTSTSSLKDLNRRMVQRGKEPVDMRRFRPNIVVDGFLPWEEDTWKKIRIGGSNNDDDDDDYAGGVEFWVWQRCGRCTMTTIDRDSLDRGPEPLATLNTFRERDHGQRNFGMHLIPVVQGETATNGDTAANTIRTGDVIEVLEYDEKRKEEWERLFRS